MMRERQGRHGRSGEVGVRGEVHDLGWLGGEAHVPFPRGSDGEPYGRRDSLRARDGFSGLALGLMFAVGLLLGGGAIWLGRRPSGARRTGLRRVRG